MEDLSDYWMILANYFKKTHAIRSQLFITKEEIIDKLKNNEVFRIKKEIKLRDSLYAYNVAFNTDEEEIDFLMIENEKNQLMILSPRKRKEWILIQKIFIKQFVRFLENSFLFSQDIFKILSNCEKETSSEIYYSRFVAKGLFGRKIDFTDVYYEKLKGKKFEEAFEKSRTKKGRIQMIEVYDKKNLFSFIINRKGEITLTKGSLYFLFKNILNSQIKILEERNAFYSNRDKLNNEEAKPILIKFEEDVFDSREKIIKFFEKLEEYKFSNISVVEKGNPFLYVNILDRKDMSSFSVRTFKKNSLLLIPKIKTSLLSLQRFSRYLIEKFMEGNTYEFDQR